MIKMLMNQPAWGISRVVGPLFHCLFFVGHDVPLWMTHLYKLTNLQVGEAKNQQNHQRTNKHLSRFMSQFPTLFARFAFYVYSCRGSNYISTTSTPENSMAAFLQSPKFPMMSSIIFHVHLSIPSFSASDAPHVRRCVPGSISYNSALGACAKVGRLGAGASSPWLFQDSNDLMTGWFGRYSHDLGNLHIDDSEVGLEA
jgi:hypothetical protein